MMSLTKTKILMDLKRYSSTIKYFKEYLVKDYYSPLNFVELDLFLGAYTSFFDEKRYCK